MALSLCLSSFRDLNNRKKNKVLFLRIDQKSCLKSILAAGFEPIIINNKTTEEDDAISCDLNDLEEKLKKHDGEILAVMATTSCFAPR